MKKNADGSLTLYIQNKSPGADKESNWLPAPTGPIYLVMRLYRPKTESPSVLPAGEGSWKAPGIVKVNDSFLDNAGRFTRAARVLICLFSVYTSARSTAVTIYFSLGDAASCLSARRSKLLTLSGCRSPKGSASWRRVAVVRRWARYAARSRPATVLRAAREITLELAASDATLATLREAFDPETLTDLVLAIAFYNAVVRFLATMQIDNEPEYQKLLADFPLPPA